MSTIAAAEAHRDGSNQLSTTNQHSKIIIACTVGGASLVLTTGLVFCLLVWRRRSRHNKLRSTPRNLREGNRRVGHPSLTTSSGRGTSNSSGDFEATLTSTACDHHFTWSPTADDLGLPLPQSRLWSDTIPAATFDVSPCMSRPDSSLRRVSHSRFPADHLSITNETHFEQVTTAAESGRFDVVSLANEHQYADPINHENSRRWFSSAADVSAGGFVYDADRLLVRQCPLSSKISSDDVTDKISAALFCAAVKTHGVADSRLRHSDQMCFDRPDRNTWEMVSWDRRVAIETWQSSRQDNDGASVLRRDADARITERLGNTDDNSIWVQRIPESARARRFVGLAGAEEQPRRVGTNRNSDYDNLTNGYDIACHSGDVFTSGSQRGGSGYRLVPRNVQ